MILGRIHGWNLGWIHGWNLGWILDGVSSRNLGWIGVRNLCRTIGWVLRGKLSINIVMVPCKSLCPIIGQSRLPSSSSLVDILTKCRHPGSLQQLDPGIFLGRGLPGVLFVARFLVW